MSAAMRASPSLIVPVESQVRELDAKLLFACVAAERGLPVVLGSRAYVHYAMPFLERGIYLAKSMRSLSDRMFEIIGKLGHEIVAWDEESLVRFSSPDYYAWRFSAKAFRQITHLFTWGRDDAEMFRNFPGYPGTPLHVTGNPRVDLLRADVRGYFDDAVRRLRERYGEFVLINTNFAFVNGFVPALKLIETSTGGGPKLAANAKGLSPAFAAGMARHQQAIFDGFRELVPGLAEAFADRTLVVRPHPSERAEPWLAIAARHPNVRVSNEGNVVPWLLAAKALVHNGCTTAVEAAVVGTPAIAFRPVVAEEYDYALPNGLSHAALTIEEAKARVGDVLEGHLGPVDDAVRRRFFDRHLASLEGPLAADRIVEALEQAGYAKRTLERPPLGRFVGGWVRGNVRTAKKMVNRLRPHHRNSAAYHAHRFPGVTVAELEERIERFRRSLGRFQSVHAAPLSRHIFRISSSGA